ncbi:MAG: processing protein [Solirubrobacteraceae bacterium]|nr:processing protein [Solirubrobacteraceae bacterium]
MTDRIEAAALIALLRAGRRPWAEYADLVEEAGSALAILERDHAPEPATLFDAEPSPPPLDEIAAEIAAWEAEGMRLHTVLDPGYPENLRAVHDRPPFVFVAGALTPADRRAIAVVGARVASPHGVWAARSIAEHLVDQGYTVVSGLAAGIDNAAHTAALARGGRTLAVIGTGLRRSYPPQHDALQRRIAAECAVISQFWPDAPPSRRSFPMRNAVMSGLSLATVVVEASLTSGSRIQARLALEHGRPVFLLESLLEHDWAREFANRPGARVIRSPDEITTFVERLRSPGALVG